MCTHRVGRIRSKEYRQSWRVADRHILNLVNTNNNIIIIRINANEEVRVKICVKDDNVDSKQ